MSDEMAGSASSFMQGYIAGMRDTKEFVKQQGEDEIFSVHRFVTEIVKKLDTMIKEKELNEQTKIPFPKE